VIRTPVQAPNANGQTERLLAHPAVISSADSSTSTTPPEFANSTGADTRRACGRALGARARASGAPVAARAPAGARPLGAARRLPRAGRDARAVDQLAAKVASRTRSGSLRVPGWQHATAYLGLVPSDAEPALPPDTAWQPVERLPKMAFDDGAIALAARQRCARSSPTRTPASHSRPRRSPSRSCDCYAAALGHEVSATNLQRVLLRRNVLAQTGERRSPGRSGGRPAAVFRFRTCKLEITDEFAVLRPPDS
jgi:hypothetical protein